MTISKLRDENSLLITSGIIRKFDIAAEGHYFVLEFGHAGPNTNDARVGDSYYISGPRAVYQRFYAWEGIFKDFKEGDFVEVTHAYKWSKVEKRVVGSVYSMKNGDICDHPLEEKNRWQCACCWSKRETSLSEKTVMFKSRGEFCCFVIRLRFESGEGEKYQTDWMHSEHPLFTVAESLEHGKLYKILGYFYKETVLGGDSVVIADIKEVECGI